MIPQAFLIYNILIKMLADKFWFLIKGTVFSLDNKVRLVFLNWKRDGILELS